MNTQSNQVLVTGASGFIASHCIIQLLKKGYVVRGTVRSLDRSASVREVIGKHVNVDNLAFVECDLSIDAGWDAAMQDCTFVLHVASPIPRSAPKDQNELIEPATQGALRALKAADLAGVKRFVMTASTASIAYGYGNTGKVFTEEDWSDPDGADNSAYTRSKTIAEKAAWNYVESSKTVMEFCTINPGAVLGPILESDYGTSAEIVLKLLTGDFPGIPALGYPLIDVRDVADLHIRAMESESSKNERFLCANEFMWMGEVAEILRETHPEYAKKLPKTKLPNWAVRLASLFDPVTRSVVFELGIIRNVDSSKAKNLLGWQPRSNREAIVATADTLIALGLVSQTT